MLFPAFFAFPFQIRQWNRSISVTITALAAARQITRRQSIANLFEMLKFHRDMEPVQNRRFQDTSIGENTPESRTTTGEGRQRGVAGAANRLEVLSDQPFDVCPGLRDGAENLTTAGFRFDIANPHASLQGVAAQCPGVDAGVDGKHVLQQISAHPVRHQSGQVCPEPVQFRCRAECDDQLMPVSMRQHAAQRNRGSLKVTCPNGVATAWSR